MSSRKPHPLSSRLASVLVVSLVTMGIGAFTPVFAARPSAAAPDSKSKDTDRQYVLTRPALVVGIFVEGLDADYVNLLRDNFGKDGFNRFINNGVTIEDIDYGTDIDPTAATAMLVTGAAPSVNGIPASRVWDSETRSDYPILLDPANIGNFTDETFSPAALKVSTIGDEVRIADGGIGLVHSVAPDAQVAIVLAGHAGNSGFWLNEFNGKWSTSTYYRDVPAAIAKHNYGVTLSSRLDTISWTPSIILICPNIRNSSLSDIISLPVTPTVTEHSRLLHPAIMRWRRSVWITYLRSISEVAESPICLISASMSVLTPTDVKPTRVWRRWMPICVSILTSQA